MCMHVRFTFIVHAVSMYRLLCIVICLLRSVPCSLGVIQSVAVHNYDLMQYSKTKWAQHWESRTSYQKEIFWQIYDIFMIVNKIIVYNNF